jgi:hypothetical protein
VHHEPPDETCGALELDVGADEGDVSFFLPDGAWPVRVDVEWWPLAPEDELLAGVETLALVDATPGSVNAIPAAAMTLAVVADTATALTRAWPRFLAAMSPPESRLLGFMASTMAGVVLANRSASSESALKAWSGTVRP